MQPITPAPMPPAPPTADHDINAATYRCRVCDLHLNEIVRNRSVCDPKRVEKVAAIKAIEERKDPGPGYVPGIGDMVKGFVWNTLFEPEVTGRVVSFDPRNCRIEVAVHGGVTTLLDTTRPITLVEKRKTPVSYTEMGTLNDVMGLVVREHAETSKDQHDWQPTDPIYSTDGLPPLRRCSKCLASELGASATGKCYGGPKPAGLMPDWMIERDVKIEPFESSAGKTGVLSYGPSSYGYDVRAGYDWRIFTNVYGSVIDPKNFDKKMLVEVSRAIGSNSPVIIPPNSFALCESLEYLEIPRDVLVVVLGKSTYARCGLIVNVTPLEPEWRGRVTMEISNTTPMPAKVYPGEGIAQFLFFRAAAPCRTSYADKKGKYQDQTQGVTLPKV